MILPHHLTSIALILDEAALMGRPIEPTEARILAEALHDLAGRVGPDAEELSGVLGSWPDGDPAYDPVVGATVIDIGEILAREHGQPRHWHAVAAPVVPLLCVRVERAEGGAA